MLAIDGVRPGFDRIVHDHSQEPERRQRLFRWAYSSETRSGVVHLQVPVLTIASRACFNAYLSVGPFDSSTIPTKFPVLGNHDRVNAVLGHGHESKTELTGTLRPAIVASQDAHLEEAPPGVASHLRSC